MGLHVNRGDALELREGLRGDGFDANVEEIRHSQVLWTGDALEGAENRCRPCAMEQVAQRQTARQGVGVRVVVEENQHAVGVCEVALILLDPGPGQRATERGKQGTLEELAETESRDLREGAGPVLGAL